MNNLQFYPPTLLANYMREHAVEIEQRRSLNRTRKSKTRIVLKRIEKVLVKTTFNRVIQPMYRKMKPIAESA